VKIHLVSYLFYPDSLGGGALYTDFARFMKSRGHEVRVTTTFSFYPQYRYREEDSGISRRDETFEEIPLRRIRMKLPRRYQGWRRLIPELSFWQALRRRARFDGWTPDVVIVGCPMLAQSLAARGLYGGGVPLIVVVQDLMVDAAAKLGIIRARGFLKLLAWGERRALSGADRLVTISEEMKTRLVELTGKNVAVMPNWIHGSLAVCASEERTRAPATLFYSGNLGVKQGLPGFLPDFFAEANGWTLQIHGDGPAAEDLRAVHRANPQFSLNPLLDEPEYVRTLSGATVCLITQRAGAGDSFLPSKLLPALATGTPVLAVCDRTSPLGREVTEHGFGVVIAPGDRETLGATLRRWREQPEALETLCRRARERSAYFQRDRILGEYERLMQRVIAEAQR